MFLLYSWNSVGGDSSDRSCACCFGLHCQEEAQHAGEATQRFAQPPLHAVHAVYAQPGEL